MHELVEIALWLEEELAVAKDEVCKQLAPLHVGDVILDGTAQITEVYIINLMTKNPQFGYKARKIGKGGKLVGIDFSVYWNKEDMRAELPERRATSSSRASIILHQLDKIADDLEKKNA